MITKSQEYALRLMCHLRLAEYRKAAEVAVCAGVPVGYAGKVLQALEKAGLLHSLRGRTGGYVRRHDIPIRRILKVFEKPTNLTRFFMDDERLSMGIAEFRNYVRKHRKQLPDWGL
jgi:Rrf2 family protein